MGKEYLESKEFHSSRLEMFKQLLKNGMSTADIGDVKTKVLI